MKSKLVTGCIALAVAAAIAAPDAAAFFPFGGFDSGEVLRIGRWKVSDFDTNGDGRITPGEGLEFLIEAGPSGFNRAEIAEIEAAFQVWEDVPTSYAAFRKAGEFQDPIVPGNLAAPDFLNIISLEITGPLDIDGDGFPDEGIIPDPPDVITGALGGGVLGFAFLGFAVEETIVDVGLGDEAFIISAGTMYDVDIVIDATAHRVPAEFSSEAISLKGTMVNLIGYMLGLSNTPLNNVRSAISDPTNPDVTLNLEENEVFFMTMPDGVSRRVGVTPSMFPYLFDTRDDFGERYDGAEDLAPDDISAVTWLYPRGDLSNIFSLRSEARTQVRSNAGLPSAPLAGGHIVAWADHDNNGSTQRIPMFSTMSGLYEIASNSQNKGKFNLYGLWKQFEVPGGGGVLFNPSYTFTFTPLNTTGFSRQAPPQLTAQLMDSIQGTIGVSTTPRDPGEYAGFTLSEVFHEVNNVIDVANKDVGTPLVWDFDQNTLVSQTSGRRVSSILSNGRPMFGDPNDACPLNFIGDGTGGAATAGMIQANNTLRGFRDNYLLHSAPGMAAVDVYYAAGPYLVKLMMDRPMLHQIAASCLGLFGLALQHKLLVFAGALGLLVLPWLIRRRFRAGAVHLFLLTFALQAMLASPAQARLQYITQESFVAGATDIFTGTVESTSSRFVRAGHIATDVVIAVDAVAKGRQNKNSYITVVVPGGRANGLVMRASSMPGFSEGERVLLYAREVPDIGHVIHGGIRGKVPILTNAKTGGEELAADNFATKLDIEAARQEAPEDEGQELSPKSDESQGSQPALEHPATISVEEYLQFLKKMVREERRR